MEAPDTPPCGPGTTRGPFGAPFLAAADLVGKRWTGAIIYSLFNGQRRFSDIEKMIDGLSSRMLSLRLKELEAAGVLRREVIGETPVRVDYHLTEMGLDLREVLIGLDRWAHRWPLDTAGDAELVSRESDDASVRARRDGVAT